MHGVKMGKDMLCDVANKCTDLSVNNDELA
jgi:hypothetical protein